MKTRYFLILFLPLLLFAHIKDERLFRTSNITSSALILLDRSGSMGDETYHYETIVRLNDYNWFDRTTELTGWYDSEIAPDGPGIMSDFVGDSINGNWTLLVDWTEYRTNKVDLSWTLKILSGGIWNTYDGGTYSWTGNWSEEKEVTINITGTGLIQDVECYINVVSDWGLTIGRMRISLLKSPRLFPYESTRMKDALTVINTLLDANNDGLITIEDESYLPVKLGHGFHRNADDSIPGDYSYVYNESYGNSGTDRGEKMFRDKPWQVEWIPAPAGILYADSIGSHFTDLWDHINFTSDGGHTPNGQLIAEGVRYINDWKASHPDLWCMKHNIILITDGLSNVGSECGADWMSNGSHEVVLQAYRAWSEDSIRVYAVGFGPGITDKGANELNWVARWGGTQKEDSAFIDSMVYKENMDTLAVDPRGGCPSVNPEGQFLTGFAYIARNADVLSTALEQIFLQIAGQSYLTYSESEVTSVEEEFLSTEYQARLYFASFKPESLPIWKGDIKAIKLSIGEYSLDSIPPDLLVWSAKESLKVDQLADARNIYGIKSTGNMIPFNSANFTKTDLDVNSPKMAEAVIDKIRDGTIEDGKGELGDIFHSSPLRIHMPNYFFVDQGFGQFYLKMKDRSPLIYAGANDGILHIFADSIKSAGGRGGEEIAGIIPMNFIPDLQDLLEKHRYFVDANAIAADVWFPQSEDDSVKQWDEWHTVLIAPQGEGGRSFTVLDVTDPLAETPHPMDSIKFLFNAMQSTLLEDTLGYTTSVPIIHKIGINWLGHERRIDRFFAFMGGGQWPEPMDISLLNLIFPEEELEEEEREEIEGNVIIGVDIWKAKNEGINGNVYIIPPISRDGSEMDAPFPASPTMINMDPQSGNRYDLLFIPDAFGQLWFIDLRDPNPSNWEAERIFIPELPTASDSANLYKWHPAFYRPLVWKDPVYGDYWVAYGTGNRSDVFSPSNDRFYALKYPAQVIEDTNITIPVYVEGDLGVPGNPSDAGWMLTLQHTNEKVVTNPIYYLDSLEFFTFTPGVEDTVLSPCSIGGQSSFARSYTFDIRTGGAEVIGGTIIGTGIPQPTRYSYSLDGTGMQINQVSGRIEIKKSKSFKSLKEIVKWKEE